MRRGHDRVRAPSSAATACRSRAGSRRGGGVHAVRRPRTTSTSARPTSSPPRGYNALVPTLRGVGRSGGVWDHGSFRQAGRDAHDLDRVARGAALLRRPDRDVRRELRWSDELQRRGRATGAPGGDRADAVAVVAVPRRGVPGRDQDDRARRHRQLARHRQHDERRRDRRRRGVRGQPRAPHVRRFWRERSFVDCLDSLAIPVLAIGGWNDGYFRSGTLANIEALPGRPGRSTARGRTSSRSRSPQEPAGRRDRREREQTLTETPQLPSGVVLAWFDHWVGGLSDVPVPPAPTFTSFEGPVGIGAGWRELDRWDPHGEHRHLAASRRGRIARRHAVAAGTLTFASTGRGRRSASTC